MRHRVFARITTLISLALMASLGAEAEAAVAQDVGEPDNPAEHFSVFVEPEIGWDEVFAWGEVDWNLLFDSGAFSPATGDGESTLTRDEVKNGTFVPDPAIVQRLMTDRGISADEAVELLEWQSYAGLEVMDKLWHDFMDVLVAVNPDLETKTLVVCVSAREDEIEAKTKALMGSNGKVEVRGGFVPVAVVAAHWNRIEKALHAAGVDASGAARPNEIAVLTNEETAARKVVESLAIPDQIAISYEPGGRMEWLTDPNGEFDTSKNDNNPANPTTDSLCGPSSAATHNGVRGVTAAGHCVKPSTTRSMYVC